jgi:hypothetical protein
MVNQNVIVALARAPRLRIAPPVRLAGDRGPWWAARAARLASPAARTFAIPTVFTAFLRAALRFDGDALPATSCRRFCLRLEVDILMRGSIV